MESVELKHYTVAQVRQWLQTGESVDGLSSMVIAPVRAWSIIHNPYILDDDPFVAAVFVGKTVAAYTAAFPEQINGDCKWWFSTLWCDPKYRGKGYGMIVIGSLTEIYGIENCLDCYGGKETIEIFSHLGMQTIYTPRYVLTIGKMNVHSLKGKLMHSVRNAQKLIVQNFVNKPVKEHYSLCYLSYIDDNTYRFIKKHRGEDLFLHTQEMMNWELKYPVSISAPLTNHLIQETSFASNVTHLQLYAVLVLVEGSIVGFYMMKQNQNDLNILYLYYDDQYKNNVFASIQDHIIHLHISHFVTDDRMLFEFMQKHLYFPKSNVANISFSYPESFSLPAKFTTQHADGDGFA